MDKLQPLLLDVTNQSIIDTSYEVVVGVLQKTGLPFAGLVNNAGTVICKWMERRGGGSKDGSRRRCIYVYVTCVPFICICAYACPKYE